MCGITGVSDGVDTLRLNVDFTELKFFLMGVAALRVTESTGEQVISKKICAAYMDRTSRISCMWKT
jgi:hypothetical protein